MPASVTYELITNNKQISNNDEYLDIKSEPTYEQLSWSGHIAAKTEITQVDNAHLEQSVTQKKVNSESICSKDS